jgi:DNA-binding SARP family transcriptional activator
VDQSDADPSTFFYFLGLAAPARKPALPLLQPEYLADLDGFAIRFFRSFFERLPEGSVWVLDNVHELPAASPLHGVIAHALDQLPLGIGAILVSRSAPAPELARAQAGGTLTSVEWPDLKLSLDETALICHGRAVTDPALIGSLHQHSDGWAAGLMLMLERTRRGHFTAPDLEGESQEAVFDYFAGQVFRSASPRDRQLLLEGAFAPRLTPEILAALTNEPDAEKLLDGLYRRHLFTDRRRVPRLRSDARSATGHRTIYQFHALFRSFLMREASRTYPTAAIRDLMDRTAGLLEDDGLIEEAVHLYAETGRWESLSALLLREAPSLLRQGRWKTLVEWAGLLPGAVLEEQPWLLFWTGKALIPIDQAAARGHLEKAWERFAAENHPTGQLAAICGIVWTHYFEAFATESMDRWIVPLEKLLATTVDFESPSLELAAYSAFQLVTMFVQPSHPKLHAAALRLLDLLDSDVDETERVSAAAFLVLYFDLIARFDLGARVIERVDRLTRGSEPSPVSMVSWLTNRGYHYYITVRYEEAMESLDRAVSLAQANGLPQGEIAAHVFRAFAAAVEGETATALQAVQAQERLLQPTWRVSLAQHHLSWALLQQLRRQHGSAAEHTRLHLAAARTTAAPFFLIVWGSCGALAQAGAYDEALALIEEVRATREGTCYTCYDGLLLLDESYVHHLRGEDVLADARLKEALAWSRAHNIPYFFRWLIHGLPELLARAVRLGIEADYARGLVLSWGIDPPDQSMDEWPWPLRITTLGDFRVVLHGEPLKFGRKAPARLLQLLKALVAMGSTDVDVRRLTAGVWPDAQGDAAQAMFTNALHRLRKLLGDDRLLQLTDGKLSLDRSRCWIDTLALESAGGDTSAEDPDSQRITAGRLLNLYRGQFLPQDTDAPWAATTRERLRSVFERRVSQLGEALEKHGNVGAAADLYRRAIEIETLTESFYRGLMRCLAVSGAQAEAVQVYRRCRDMLSIVLGLQPSAPTKALFESIRRDADGPAGDAASS